MNHIIKPKKIEKGDTIGLVSPSEPVFFPDRFERGIQELERMGFNILVGKSVHRKYGYMAGTDQERADDINEMFANQKVKAIFTTTGGSSANRLLPLLDYELIKDNPKIFLGISDITVLLNAIHAKTGLVTFHGPYLLYGICDMLDYDREYFLKAFTQSSPIGRVKILTQREVLKEGKATGKLLGGNFKSLRSLFGTPYNPDWNGAIFFWEEYKTEPHKIDRMLMHFKLIGAMDEISGMIMGNLSACKEKKYEKECPTIQEIIVGHCNKYEFPVMYNLDFGHNCHNVTIPIGVQATIDTANGTFSIDDSGVTD